MLKEQRFGHKSHLTIHVPYWEKPFPLNFDCLNPGPCCLVGYESRTDDSKADMRERIQLIVS